MALNTPDDGFPSVKPPGQKWVGGLIEPTINTPVTGLTARWWSHIDWTATPSLFSTFPALYQLPGLPAPGFDSPTPPKTNTQQIGTFASSSDYNRNFRYRFMEDVMKALPGRVVGVGRVHNNYQGCAQALTKASHDCLHALVSQYHFNFAMENSEQDGYITEKFSRGFRFNAGREREQKNRVDIDKGERM